MSDTELLSKPEPVRRLEVFTGAGHRRAWTVEQKARIVAESYESGETVCAVARRHGLTPQQLFDGLAWARLHTRDIARPTATRESCDGLNQSARPLRGTSTRESDSSMVMPIDAVPDEIEALRARVSELLGESDAAIAENHRLSEQNDQLWHLLKQLQRAQFGRRSERLDPDQMQLALEDVETSLAQQDAEADKKSAADIPADRSKQRRINRGALPTHLPRVHITLAPESTVCPCCQGPMHLIGEDTAERLDVTPAQYRVIVTHRPKYGCRACEGAVVQAAAPDRLVKSGIRLRRSWPPSLSTSMPGTSRSIGRRRSWRCRACR
jgi:transposase-like protein